MFFRSPKGIIALDIDGTITADAHALNSDVAKALYSLKQNGWEFIFLTGRPFSWSWRTLKPLSFTYTLAVQNGSLLLQMPSKTILSRKYLTTALFPTLESICQDYHTDFVVYSGLENGDWCYYRPTHLSSSILAYVLERTAYLGEKWQPLPTFSAVPISLFPSVKFFVKEDQAFQLSQSIEKRLNLHAPPNRDPFNLDHFVIQVTHQEATKGQALKEFIQLKQILGPIIAAGDDYNDQSMLEVADMKIVMANAPADLLEIADVIAPPAIQQGIIQGLKEAIQNINVNKGQTYV